MSPRLDNNIIRTALDEDAVKKDITSAIIVPKGKKIKAAVIAREPCVVCGLDIARNLFKALDKKIKFTSLAKDGGFLKKGRTIAKIEGSAGSILAAERVALNFLALLSGVATNTQRFVKAAKPYKAKILDTRKTIPGLRKLQKYAVKTGGGCNHRMNLSDMVLIKDNHIKISAAQRKHPYGLKNIIEQARRKAGKKIKIEIEVQNLVEFKDALKAAPDIIMLDNMRIPQMRKAVKILRSTRHAKGQSPQRRTLLEASGGITLKNVKKVSATGIDMISVGGLTHSVKSIDLSLEII